MKSIVKKDNVFVINTNNTSYVFRIVKELGLVEHLYYGRRIHIESIDTLVEKRNFGPGNTIVYGKVDGKPYFLENMCLEFSARGHGDIREPMVELVDKSGNTSFEFEYDSYMISEGKTPLRTLPSSYYENNTSDICELRVYLKDEYSGIRITLIYTVFPESDVITKSLIIDNLSEESIVIRRAMSNLLDINKVGLTLTTFRGAWTREMKRYTDKVMSGTYVNSSYTGTSSNRSNPFFMLSDSNASENGGECYGFNLIYSGNHYEAIDVNAYNKTRVVQGINPSGFSWVLESGDFFETPEAVLTYSNQGFNSLSERMHDFVRNHIVRGVHKNRPRPVLINSWEASYFDISYSSLMRLAKASKKVGVELFVMDDGWFGERNDDTSSLGDWEVNLKKLPGGIKRLASDINALGLDFGIWVEPEMISVNSRLYREHPDWAMDVPGRTHSEGRNQRVLDLTRVDIQDYLIEKMSEVFGSGNISYVKWDMNRIITDYYSKGLDSGHQGEVAHRYVLGLYRVMGELTKRFPEILFEGCASGGNRFDLGILCYFPQIWASDNTDALCRAEIQNNYSYGYPQSCYTAHVSGIPNHQTLRRTPLETRYNVASFGILGYECNLCDLDKREIKAIATQIAQYKRNRQILQYGQLYRGRSYGSGTNNCDGSVLSDDMSNIMEWTIVSKDQKSAVGMILQKMVHPNSQYECYYPMGLNESKIYQVRTQRTKVDIKEYGDLINTVAPVHIRQNSALHDIASRLVRLSAANESYSQYGDALMYGGISLNEAFSGTGMNDDTRHFPDYASIMFIIESE